MFFPLFLYFSILLNTVFEPENYRPDTIGSVFHFVNLGNISDTESSTEMEY